MIDTCNTMFPEALGVVAHFGCDRGHIITRHGIESDLRANPLVHRLHVLCYHQLLGGAGWFLGDWFELLSL